MSTERDIIIERLEQKLSARDKELTQMQEALRESIIVEMEKRFSDKIKLRESTLEDIKSKFGEKINEIIQMNKSLRDSVMEYKRAETDTIQKYETRMEKIDHRLAELNSAYDGVMKELLDQKSIIQELMPKKPKEEPKQRQDVIKEDASQKGKPKTQYIIADNYLSKDQKNQQQIIEANEKPVYSEEIRKEQLKEQLNRPPIRKSQNITEGVEISETLKRGK